MRFTQDQRAQAIQVGAVILFGLLIVVLSFYQAFIVPDQNEEIEFNHNGKIQQQMTELRNVIISMPGTTTTKSVSLDLGVRYPARTIFINPGPASGTVRTVATTDDSVALTIENATATGDVGDFWDGSQRGYNTGAIQHRPGYNRYTNAPRTVYEQSVLYNYFERQDSRLPMTGQTLVKDDRITIVTVNGSMVENRVESVAVEVEPVSTRTRTVEVTNETDPITLAVPTALNTSEWEDLLEDEMTPDGHVVNVSPGPALPAYDTLSLVEITLEPGVDYKLQMAKVGVGTEVTETEKAYLTGIEGDGATIEEGSSRELVFEVRDPYNNPISDVSVRAATNESRSSVSPADADSNQDGTVSFVYEAPDDVDGQTTITDQINVSIEVDPDPLGPFDASTPTNVTMNVTIENTDGSGLGGNGSTSPYEINFDTGQISNEPGLSCNDGVCEYDFADDGDTEFDLTAFTSPAVVGADVDFALNTTASGEFSSASDNETDSPNGEAVGVFNASATGEITAYVTSGGSGDELPIRLINTASDVVFSAVSPDPDELSDDAGEFIRVYFPSDTNTTGWTIEDDESTQGTTLPSETLQGEVYFAGDADAFAAYWQIDESKVYEFDDSTAWLRNGGEPLKLNDSSGSIVDEFAYEGPTTTNNWTKSPVGSGDVAVRKDTGTAYIDTDEASDWVVESETDFFPDSNGGLRTVSATSIVPNASGQRQTFEFELDTDMVDATEDVKIVLDAAQQTSPLQVDYPTSDAAVEMNRSGSATIATGSDTATITLDFTTAPSQGDTINVTVSSIDAGTPSNQNTPYDVRFQRTDVYSNSTTTFDVAKATGTSELSSVSVGNVTESQSGETQTVSFTLASDIADGETVTVDLSDAQASGVVDYSGAGFTVNSGGGSVSNSGTSASEAYFQYEASGDSAGETIEVEISGIDTGTQPSPPGAYRAAFSRGDADTKQTTFSVEAETSPFFDVEILDTNDPETAGKTMEIFVNVTNTGGATDTQTLELRDSDFSGTVQDTVDVTLGPGQSNNSILLEWDTSSSDIGTGNVSVLTDNRSVSEEVTVEQATMDNFEDGDISEYGGDTNQFTNTTSTVYDGTQALAANPTGNAVKTIESTTGLPSYPKEGDTFAYNFNPADFANQQYVAGIEFGESSSGNNYAVSVRETGGQTNTFELVVDNGTGAASSVINPGLSTGQWYQVNVEWNSTNVTAELTNASTGTVLATVTVRADGSNNVDYLAFTSQAGQTFFDHVRRT